MWSDGLHTTATYVSLKRAILFDTSAKHLLGLRYQQMAVRRTEDWRCLQLPSSCKRSWKSCLPLPCMVILLFLTRRKDSCIVFDAVIVMMELVPPTFNKKDVPTLDDEAWLHFLLCGRGYCSPRSPRKQCWSVWPKLDFQPGSYCSLYCSHPNFAIWGIGGRETLWDVMHVRWVLPFYRG